MDNKIEGCFHLIIKNGNIVDGFSHLTNFPEDCVIHLIPDNVFSNEEFIETHQQDINELNSKGDMRIYNLKEKSFMKEFKMLANKERFKELMETVNGQIEFTDTQKVTLRTNPLYCYEVLTEAYGEDKAKIVTEYLFEGAGMEKGKSLLDQAVSMSNSIKDKKEKSKTLKTVSFELVKAGEIDKCLNVVKGIVDPKIQNEAYSDAAIEIAKVDLQRALTVINSMSDPASKSYTMAMIGKELISEDIKNTTKAKK